jgi:uncharacterized protein YjbJ (UPF0337 family)
MIDENQVEGAAQEFGGTVQDAVGGVMGDEKMQAEGKWNKAAGQAKQTFGEAAEEVREQVIAKPLTALAIVAGVFLTLGFLARR